MPARTPAEEPERVASRCKAEGVQPTLEMWDRLKQDVLPFQKMHFGLEEEDLIDAFKNPDATIAILRDTVTNKVVGFSYAEPVQQAYRTSRYAARARLPRTAYVQNTALEPSYTGHGLVGPLTELLEAELVAKGYEYLERDASVANDYARKIQENYSDRIVLAQRHASKWGEQVFFRIRIAPTPESSD